MSELGYLRLSFRLFSAGSAKNLAISVLSIMDLLPIFLVLLLRVLEMADIVPVI